MHKNKGLGKGLSALIEERNYFNSQKLNNHIQPISDNSNNSIFEIDIKKITPNKSQPRIHFDQNKLEELTQSIKEHGIIQPIILEQPNSNTEEYTIIAGERRYKAAILSNLKTIPALILDINNQKTLEIALIENIQREDLNVIEEANAYHNLIEKYDYTQEELSNKLGKSRSHITNILRLLSLENYIQQYIIQGDLTIGHAKLLLTLPKEKQLQIISKIINNHLSVRNVEKLIKSLKEPVANITDSKKEDLQYQHQYQIPSFQQKYEKEIARNLDLRTKISYKNHKGTITINFHNQQDFDKIISTLTQK